MSNEILSLGDRVEIEELESMQEEIYSKGKERRVKITRSGKRGNRAPKMLEDILNRKLSYLD